MLWLRRCLSLCNRRKWRVISPAKVLCIFFIFLLMYLLLFFYSSDVRTDILMITTTKHGVKDEILNLSGIDFFQFQGEDNSPFSNLINISLYANFNENPTTSQPLQQEPQFKRKKKDITKLHSDYVFSGPSKTNRYLFILGHYEQLGKTTINFIHARYLAYLIGRDLVVPFVRNSRFCGLQYGWIGPRRKKSREFLPMDNYFKMSSFENLLPINEMSRLATLEEYHQVCSLTSGIMIYFIYAVNKLETKRYLQLSDIEYDSLVVKMKENKGWFDCLFIENKLQSGRRMKNMRFSQAICVDPEVIDTVEELDVIMHDTKCAAIFLWRGIGEQRTHFNLSLPSLHWVYLQQLEFSDLVIQEVNRFLLVNFLHRPYIGIQIRAERQLAWYNIKKLKQCLDLVIKVVNILVLKKSIKHVFISSDLEKHGSDQISVLLNTSTQRQARHYFHETVMKLNGVLYKPDKSRGLIYNDAGFVALTQMEILSRSKHLVTVGAGTFQSWIVGLFKKHAKKLKRSWSLTRVCATELKKGISARNTAVSPTAADVVTPIAVAAA